MLRFSHALLLSALTLSLTACGAGKEITDQLLIIDEFTAPSNTSSGGTNRFPHVRHATTKSIADSINSDLVAEVFGVEWSEDLGFFDMIMPSVDGMVSVNDVSYNVIENNARYLALSISGEGCGAYCEPFIRHLNYDAATGRRITLDQLFTGSGLAILADSVRSWKRGEIVAFLDDVGDDASGGRGDDEEKEYVDEMIAMYEGCLASLDEYGEDLSYADFAIDPGAVTIYLSRCSNHAMRALDELWEHEYIASIKQWKKHLSPYGRLILNVQ